MRQQVIRRIGIVLPMLWMVLVFFSPAYAQAVPEITAEAAVLMDLDTGEVLYGKHEHERRPPASLTKVMTGYIAARAQTMMKQEVAISKTAAQTGESSLNLKA